MLPKSVDIVEVGPREGFQYEGIGAPDKISTADKIALIQALAETGLKVIRTTSFVNPKQVPQMADAEAVVAGLTPREGVSYTGTYLNDIGLKRAIATGKLDINGRITLTASETFSKVNQRRDFAQDLEMARKLAALYRDMGVPVEGGNVTAAFGCNFEGDIPLQTVLDMIAKLDDVIAEIGDTMKSVTLADTVGWANPNQVRTMIAAIRQRWPEMNIHLHLHDTRGLGIANVYAALLDGVTGFDAAVAGLGGCPFAGHKGAAGNVCTEEVVFLCQELGIETGIDLDKLVEAAELAETIVGHPVPSALVHKKKLSLSRLATVQ